MHKYIIGAVGGGLAGLGIGFYLGARTSIVYANEKIRKYKVKNSKLCELNANEEKIHRSRGV